MNIDIVPIPLPQSADAPVDPLYEAYTQVLRAVDIDFFGNDDLVSSAYEHHVVDSNRKYERAEKWVAFPSGKRAASAAIGVGEIGYPLADNTHLAFVWIATRPGHEAQGIAKRLLPVVEQSLRESGRTTVQVWVNHHPYDGDDGLTAKSGVGAVNPADPATRWLETLGFTLEQTERHSVLEIPADGDSWWTELDSRLERDSAVAGGDYELIQWSVVTPEEYRENFARLRERMSVDAPDADLDFEEEKWDAARVAEREQQILNMRRDGVNTFVRHVPSGQLVAYTEMYWPRERPTVIYQWDTFVHSEHRGHRLGAIVKAANLRYLRSRNSDSLRIHTWNAGENAYMLNINVELGFAPHSIEAAWQKRI